MSREVSHRNFKSEVINSDRVVVAEFWAPWCSSCIKLANVIEELEKEIDSNVKFVRINVDENSALAEKLNITNLPTILIIKNNKIKKLLRGFTPKQKLEHEIKKILD